MYDIEREMIARAKERIDELNYTDQHFIEGLADRPPAYQLKPGELKKLRNIHVQLQGGEFWSKITPKGQRWARGLSNMEREHRQKKARQ